MSAPPLAITGCGMVSGVGLSAPASCAAIRCAIDNFQETRFMDSGGEWIRGCAVPLEQPWRGIARLAQMLAMALAECLRSQPELSLQQIPLLLCVAEPDRPGRLDGLDGELLPAVEKALAVRFNAQSQIIAYGRAGGAMALLQARRLIYEHHFPAVVVAGVDSLLVGPTLNAFEKRERLLTSTNSNGFIPGEAAAAILVQEPRHGGEPQLLCRGLGFGTEQAAVEAELPLRADGLVQAIQAALGEAGCNLAALDFRITDNSGEQYGFKEASLALTRILRQRKEECDIWHPADCIGEVGAAIGPVLLTVVLTATCKAYAPGNHLLCHISNDDGRRAAAVMSYQPLGAA